VNAGKKSIGVKLSDLSLFPTPASRCSAEFTLDYKSDNFQFVAKKEQYWRQDTKGEWKISVRKIAEPPALAAGLAALSLDERSPRPLSAYLAELGRSGTALTTSPRCATRPNVTRHVLDRSPFLPRSSRTCREHRRAHPRLGSGAGLPGHPAGDRASIVAHAVDSNGKRRASCATPCARWAFRMSSAGSRPDRFPSPARGRGKCPRRGEGRAFARPYAAIVSRAYASLTDFWTPRALHCHQTALAAMKGKLDRGARRLPGTVRVVARRRGLPGLTKTATSW